MNSKIRVISCGILKEEVRHVLSGLEQEVDLVFLDSSLHIYPDRLQQSLVGLLEKKNNYIGTIVIYGVCHPFIDRIWEPFPVFRLPVQNCIELLLGPQKFAAFLEEGAFFLLADWAHRWEEISKKALGGSPQMQREFLQDQHRFLLGIRNPMSVDFTVAAQTVSRLTGLPLKWYDATLDYLKETVTSAVKEIVRL